MEDVSQVKPSAHAKRPMRIALVGILPIVLGLGAGAELRQPLGLAVVGGCCSRR